MVGFDSKPDGGAASLPPLWSAGTLRPESAGPQDRRPPAIKLDKGEPVTDKEKRSQAELDAGVRTQRIHVVGETISRTWAALVKWSSLAFMAWTVERTLSRFAGKNTLADISLSALINIDGLPIIVGGLSVVFGVGGIAYGRAQAELRRTTVERLHQYQEKYERSIQPGRTTSKLTPRGDTRPEDQDG